MMANILDLSSEIIAAIAEYLEADDLFNYRLACRYLGACSRQLFIKRHFRQRVHLLSPEGLKALYDISCQPDLGPAIRSIYLSADHLPPEYLCRAAEAANSIPVPGLNLSPANELVMKPGYKMYSTSQEVFRNLGLEVTCLARILRKASNCHTVGIDRSERPWGAGIMKRETGIFPTSRPNWLASGCFIERAIHVMIGALAASEAQITTLNLWTDTMRNSLHPYIFEIPEFCWDKTLPWIASLKELKLSLGPIHDEDPDLWAKSLSRFIMQFPRLESLGMDFDLGLEQEAFVALKQRLVVPGIQKLELVGIRCYPEDLSDFFYVHHNTLREIRLCYVEINKETGGSWQSLVAGIRDGLSLDLFEMSSCGILDGDDIGFGEGNRTRDMKLNVRVLATGRDHDLFDRLIGSMREVCADLEVDLSTAYEFYIISGPVS